MHPAASIEIRQFRRMRGRIHVEAHPTLAELTMLTVTDGDGADFEFTLNLANLQMLHRQLEAQLDRVQAFIVEDEEATA